MLTRYWWKCPRCNQKVGTIDDKYAPWCRHIGTVNEAHKPCDMELTDDDLRRT